MARRSAAMTAAMRALPGRAGGAHWPAAIADALTRFTDGVVHASVWTCPPNQPARTRIVSMPSSSSRLPSTFAAMCTRPMPDMCDLWRTHDATYGATTPYELHPARGEAAAVRWKALKPLQIQDMAGALLVDEGRVLGTLLVATSRPARELHEPMAELRRHISERLAACLDVVAHLGNQLPAVLSPREREVASLVLDGYSDSAIAATLGITESTVGFHLSRMFPKAGVHSRAQLVRWLLA